MLKLRLANIEDPDFIEVELPNSELTFEKLVKVCCEELNINAQSITKIRKLPNTILRKDKDIQRLKNFQEIEVFFSKDIENPISNESLSIPSSNKPIIVNKNQYESISKKKNQIVLY